MQYCPMANYHYLYGKVFGGTPNSFMFWLFPENGSISEQTVNRALIVQQTYNILHQQNIYVNFHFRHVPKLSIGFKGEVQ